MVQHLRFRIWCALLSVLCLISYALLVSASSLEVSSKPPLHKLTRAGCSGTYFVGVGKWILTETLISTAFSTFSGCLPQYCSSLEIPVRIHLPTPTGVSSSPKAYILKTYPSQTLQKVGTGLSNYLPGEVIIRFSSDDTTEINAFLDRSGAYSAQRVFSVARHDPGLSAVYLLRFSPNANVASIVQQYEGDPAVEYVQPNYINHLCAETGEPNDSFYEDQWALHAIDALKAWKIEKGSPDVVIAIVDTGVDYNHEDLESRIWINPGEIDGNRVDDDGNGYVDDIRGWDFTDSPNLPSDVDYLDRDNDPMDESGHGTHVAGVAAAVPDNSTGTAGITWNCRIMALRGGGKFLEDDDLAAAVVYAADNGAHIINMSWGSEVLSYVIRDAMEYAYSRGCVLIAAAGNDDRPFVIYPALYKHVISVGATDIKDKKASFSNYGPGIDIVAPGHKIFATTPNDKYSDWSGTSMASPVVSGVAALILSKRPGLTNEEVGQILRSSADEIDEPLFNGVGRVNAENALKTNSPLMVSIASPDNWAEADTEVTIRGTAAGFRFLNFQLEYRDVLDVDSLTSFDEADWKPVDHAQDDPVFDDVLGSWRVADIEEGVYVIRLKAFGEDYTDAEDTVILSIDHSPPEITDVRTVSRLDGDRYRHVVTWRTDDLTSGEFHYRMADSAFDFKKLPFSALTNGHALYASDELEPGSYEFFVTATNAAGLPAVDDNGGNYYALEVENIWVPSDGFIEIPTGIPAMHPVSGTADFDGDGRLEIVGTAGVKWEYDTIKIYERDDSGQYNEVFENDKDCFPWDTGDTDMDGLLEVLGNNRDTTFLYESPSPGEYPTEKIWEAKGVWGGKIADMDSDGQKEVVSRNLDNNEIYVYENRGDNSYLRAARLKNPTEGGNRLGTTFAISDFDDDHQMDLVVGDSDGDLFVYENTANDRYSNTWTGSVGRSEVEYIAAGDFDGDGVDEFVVGSCSAGTGAQVKGQLDAGSSASGRQTWICTVFDSIDQNEYEAVWSVEISGLKSKSGISAGDLDNDGRDEIAVLVTPNLYLFRYENPGLYVPIWNHSASFTRWPTIDDLDVDGANEILFNDGDGLTIFRWSSAASKIVSRPWGLSARPLGETEVELRWNGALEARSYRIYRNTDAGRLQMIASVEGGIHYFRDDGLRAGVTYWYSVSSVDSAGRESDFSQKASATPNLPPELLSAEFSPPFTVRLTFTEAMGSSAQSETHYLITSESGFSMTPSSALLDSHGKRVTMTIDSLPPGTYTVTASDVRDDTGVTILTSANSATFHVPVPDVDEFTDLSRLAVYPNPVMPNSKHLGRVTFDNLPPSTAISIHDYSGQLVRILHETETERGRKLWYLDNDEHDDIASGVYIYVAECPNDSRMGKIAVIR